MHGLPRRLQRHFLDKVHLGGALGRGNANGYISKDREEHKGAYNP